MAYTTPKTWSVAETLTAGDMNTYVRDNVQALATPPIVQAQRTAVQSIPATAWTAIAYSGTEIWDTNGFHDTVTDNTKLTVPTGLGGLYRLDCYTVFAGDSGGTVRIAAIYKNGSEILTNPNGYIAEVQTPISGQSAILTGTRVVALSAGDYVELFVYHDKVSAINVTYSAFTAQLVSY